MVALGPQAADQFDHIGLGIQVADGIEQHQRLRGEEVNELVALHLTRLIDTSGGCAQRGLSTASTTLGASTLLDRVLGDELEFSGSQTGLLTRDS